MPLVALLPDLPWEHLKVSPEAWFYMNHMEAQIPTAAHDHNYLELAFVMGGAARHITVHGEATCRAGDVFLIPIGAWHGYTECHELELYNCLFSPSLLSNELAWLAKDALCGQFFGMPLLQPMSSPIKWHLNKTQLKDTRACLENLEGAYQKQTSRMAVLGRILLLLDILRDGMGDSMEALDVMHPGIRQALMLLNQEYAREWDLKILAKEVGLSAAYLVRLFRGITGRTPIHYLECLRAEHAATFLVSSSMRIGEIGERVGWPEPKHFARCFQRHFGLSASAYRQRMQNTIFGT